MITSYNIFKESFVPKRILQRQEELDLKNAKLTSEYNIFLQKFKHNFSKLQDIYLENTLEQKFLDLIKDDKIIVDQDICPFSIFGYNKENLIENETVWNFEYDWKNNDLYLDNTHIFKHFDMQQIHFSKFIISFFKKYFNIDLKYYNVHNFCRYSNIFISPNFK